MMQKPKFPASIMLPIYRWWHGSMHRKGAGFIIKNLASISTSLQQCPLALQEGQTVHLDFRDISAFSWINYTLGEPFEETGLIKSMASLITTDSVVWDVGANCGKVSYVLAKETPARKIVFFEPIDAVYKLAQAALEPFGHVSGLNIAVSDSSGKATLLIPRGNSTMAEITAENGDYSVECRTGDDLIATGAAPPPNILKIDTEGHEAKVLAGLRQTIISHRPTIFFEHLSFADSEIYNLVPPGYELFSVSNKDGVLGKGFDRRRGHNTALLPIV